MRTEQETFWAGAFGDTYTDRNATTHLVSQVALFTKILARTEGVDSAFELGANCGTNLRALRTLLPKARLGGVEINRHAYEQMRQIEGVQAVHGSLLDLGPPEPCALTFTSGVLIHIAPDRLPVAYAKLVEASRRYVVVIEYYNPTPVEVSYRGHTEKLFKRDFAGELLDAFALRLVDYGFVWRRDPNFPADDVTWFLLEKRA